MEGTNAPQRRSFRDLVWIDPVLPYGEGHLLRFCRRLGISEALGRILAARDLVDDEEAAFRFLHPDVQQLHPPFRMKDMDTAVRRIIRAVEGYEKILVFGDYDVDGTASASILYSYLKRLGARAQYYIPHRLHDGYGFTPQTVHRIREWRVDLVITTDHGSTDLEGPELLRQAGVELIITDHHQLGPARPDAAALVNPQQPGCPYPFKGLAAAGVVYKLISALDSRLTEQDFFNRHGICHTRPEYFLDLVALATVADMAPLLGENRILVKLGLEQLNTRPKPGLRGLIRECRIRGRITPSVISFKLAPKINALGRIGDPRLGMQLLLSHSFTESRRIARGLLEANRARQEIEREAFLHAQEQMSHMPNRPAFVLVGTDWHPGVIGTVATRIAAQTGKPTVVLTLHDQAQAVGSARSTEGYDILHVLESCEPVLERFGGHPSAAGLVVDPANLQAFTRRFLGAVQEALGAGPPEARNRLPIDAWVDPAGLTRDLVAEVERLSPFGYRNPEPVVAVRGLRVGQADLLHNRHIRFCLRDGEGEEVDAVAWDQADWEVQPLARYDIAFLPQTHYGPDGPRLRLRVLDLMDSDTV